MEHPKNAGTNPRNNKCAVVMMDGISLLALLLLMVEGLSVLCELIITSVCKVHGYSQAGQLGGGKRATMRSVFSTYDRRSVLRPSEKKCPHQSNSQRDDTYKFGHRFDNIVDPNDKI